MAVYCAMLFDRAKEQYQPKGERMCRGRCHDRKQAAASDCSTGVVDRSEKKPLRRVTFELPSKSAHCTMGCSHCIHEASESSQAELSLPEIVRLLEEGETLGAKSVVLYPHRSDVTLNFDRYEPLFAKARSLGYRIKSITSGADPAGMKELLPWVDQLSISVDSLDKKEYCHVRSEVGYTALLKSLVLLGEERSKRRLQTTALVMVDTSTAASIERRCDEIWATGLFDRIKIREILPLGRAKSTNFVPLCDEEVLRVSELNSQYYRERVQGSARCCSSSGKSDLVIGPCGELTDCVLLYYENEAGQNIRDFGHLKDLFESESSVKNSVFQCDAACANGADSCIARTLLEV